LASSVPFTPEVIAAMKRAYVSVWQSLYGDLPDLNDDEAVEEMSAKLNRTLVRLASKGITDAEELRRRAIESMHFFD
jgi:hypothetical protein